MLSPGECNYYLACLRSTRTNYEASVQAISAWLPLIQLSAKSQVRPFGCSQIKRPSLNKESSTDRPQARNPTYLLNPPTQLGPAEQAAIGSLHPRNKCQSKFGFCGRLRVCLCGFRLPSVAALAGRKHKSGLPCTHIHHWGHWSLDRTRSSAVHIADHTRGGRSNHLRIWATSPRVQERCTCVIDVLGAGQCPKLPLFGSHGKDPAACSCMWRSQRNSTTGKPTSGSWTGLFTHSCELT